MRSKLIIIAIFAVGLAAGRVIYKAIVSVVLSPCNPICFPNSYNETNPDCPCNHEE